MSDWRAKTRVFYGWYVVAALFVLLFNTAGMGFYVFPVFIESFQEDFGWSEAQIAGSAALWAIIFGFSGPVVGMLISRYGARKTMLIAAALASLTNLGFAVMQKLWMLYLINLVAGFVVAGTTLVPAQTLVTNWFDKYRGRAMALTMIGIGAGGALLPILNEWMIREIGWRLAWVVACLVLWCLLIPIITIFIRTRPSDMGLLPDGEAPEQMMGVEDQHAMSGLTVKSALTTAAFWLLACIFVMQLLGVSALNYHFVRFAIKEIQFTAKQAAFYYGMAVGFSIVGRLLFGWLADRFKPHVLTAIAGCFLAIGPAMLWYFFIKQGIRVSYLLSLHSIPFGIGIGANAIMIPVLVGRCFGELHFSKIMGLVMIGFAAGIVIGIPVAAYIFEQTGTYTLVFIMCFLALVISGMLALFIRPDKYTAEFETESSL